MELWIRTQDKKNLLKVEEISCYSRTIYLGKSGTFPLGTYKSEKRAIEVLDEIQKIWCPPTNFIVSQHIDFDNNGEGLIGCNILKEEPKIERISDVIVYEMPKE